MSGLISRDEAIRLCAEEFDGVCVYDVSSSEVISDFEYIINSTPTVDAVPVVRCKDCKHSKKPTKAEKEVMQLPDEVLLCLCTVYVDAVFPDDFCSYGERREDGETD